MAEVQKSVSLRLSGGLLVAAFCFLLALYFYWQNSRPQVYALRMTGGDSLGRRHELVKMLATEATAKHLRISTQDTKGSRDALQKIQQGKLDAALIQGGIPFPADVRLVASLNLEPLHLLVKKRLAGKGLKELKGCRVNLSTPQSGTRILATTVCRFAGLEPGDDFTVEDRPYAQLEALSDNALPDAVFIVSSLPSPVADYLIRKRGYTLVPLPFGDALALREPAIFTTEIPAYTHGVLPPTPATSVPTVGNHLLLVAGKEVPNEAVRGYCLDCVFCPVRFR